jgi:hypothetical protein
MSIGQHIIDAIIEGSLIRIDSVVVGGCVIQPASSVLVWSANAAEQLTTLVEDEVEKGKCQ